jgi:hypothetical protein
VVFSLEGIEDSERMLESACREEFATLRPSLMGALFDAVSRAMVEVGNIHLDSMPRMADFARWGCAAARALGHSDQGFLEAFGANVRAQNESALESSPVA